MNKYEFKLTPAYCLYNGTAVMEQQGSSIKFITERPYDSSLRKRLSRAFFNFVNYVISQEDCPEEFRLLPNIEFYEGNRQQIKKWVSRLYGSETEKSAVNKEKPDTKEMAERDEAAAVVLLDTILTEARTKGATDIHIEENHVKFRINGKLQSEITLDEKRNQELIQRIKFLSGMNVMEKRKSQDGNFIFGKENPVFFRVSSMATIGKDYSQDKESLVIRVLDSSRTPLSLDKLGFFEEQTEKIRNLCNEKNGLIIICGPTGAGKSTTAASMLMEIRRQKKNNVKIISLEDPPEYVLPGVTQIRIDEKTQNTFSEALVHVFRQDPDVLLIGEIRDEKSASAAIRGALTGHLVVATLHTASASGAILRLEDLGISRNVIVSVLKGVIVQEMNHLKERVNLLADVSVPKSNLSEKTKESLSEAEMNECFSHLTNYCEPEKDGLLSRSLSGKSLPVLLEDFKKKEAVKG